MHIKYNYKWYVLILLMLVFVFLQWHTPQQGLAASDINLVIDGENITTLPSPVIENSRTLVPIRFVSEKLGAQVEWNNQNRTVLITKNNRSVLLRIDSHLIEYNTKNEKTFNLSDIAPKIIDSHTFVPLRLVSNALSVAVRWEDSSRTIYVNSSEYANITPFFHMKLQSIEPGQMISSMTELQSSFTDSIPDHASEIRYLLLDPDTGRGTVVSRGSTITGKYYWLPDLQENGEKVIVSAVYDSKGTFLSGDAALVQVSVIPEITLSGIEQGEKVKDTVSLNAYSNFIASYIKYEITNHDNNNVFISKESDPQGVYKWTPTLEYNGNVSIKAIAYDRSGQAYESQPITIKVNAPRKLELKGVKSNSTIEKAVTLSCSQNFQVSQTEYILKDAATGEEIILSQSLNSSYEWFPGTELTGSKELYARVRDTSGNTYTSNPIPINLAGTPKMVLEGIGPEQVITGSVKLKSSVNTTLNSIQYTLTNSETGAKKIIAEGSGSLDEYTWVPVKDDEGRCRIQAEGILPSGNKVFSKVIPVSVYLGTTYSSKPVIEKDQFLGLVSGLARQSWQKSGMSAALQVAQAILETGWGQSVPVDKYSGTFSYNLFGIKGTGPSGSVVSNTWEEYSGQAFRVDANFRAYGSVNESWADHKKLLLTLNRYEPFRAVMHDSTQGAWALRRCGYATDSKYPLKLIDIINTYDLKKLDEVGI